jgi:hypothetical protein
VNVRSSVERWYVRDTKEMGEREPATVHMDELFKGDWKPDEPLTITRHAYAELVDIASDNALALLAGLVIPLNFKTGELYGRKVEPAPRGWDEIGAAISRDEPPLLYILRRKILLELHPWHGYREPLPGLFTPPSSGQIYSYYEVSRNAFAIEEGDLDMQRSIIAEYYPNDLVPTRKKRPPR